MMGKSVFFARTRSNPAKPGELERQPLEDHLNGVAGRAARFAAAFSSSTWGHLAGRWHDLGKYQAAFQRRLDGSGESVDHSAVGARLAVDRSRSMGPPIAFVTAGHHAGLANFRDSGEGLPCPLVERLGKVDAEVAECNRNAPPSLTSEPFPDLPGFLSNEANSGATVDDLKRRKEFWIRFLFSALVDADRLDSEAFDDATKGAVRGRYAGIADLTARLDNYIDAKVAALREEERRKTVNARRAEILEACRCSSSQPPGLFSLTVPTGGGKTLSAMSFALRHARQHDLRRIIVVIPYTSIIEQNAREYAKALGEGNVVEHHSNFDLEKAEKEKGRDFANKQELATENWDAPVIVTTTVQFFESLFSNQPARCRKIHNIARSVIVLDEVQTLPPGFLLSILDALNSLAEHYGCTILLSTATPPALKARASGGDSGRPEFPGLRGVREIVADPVDLALRLKRVDFEWPNSDETTSLDEIARQAAELEQVLVVVHRRDDARILAQELLDRTGSEDALFHLSALMCPAHRFQRLEKIRMRLKAGLPCRLVSTQLVEAGVDLDFPVVFRALAGLDSLVQAAGRCNREGRSETGRVVIFRAESKPPMGTPRKALQVTQGMLAGAGGALDLTNPEIFDDFFRRLYALETLDARAIQTQRANFNFATVGESFRLIEDGFTHTIVVPWGEEGEKRIEAFRALGPSRSRFRGLQPYSVSVYEKSFKSLLGAGAVEDLADGLHTLSVPYRHLYTEAFGLVAGDEIIPDVVSLIQ